MKLRSLLILILLNVCCNILAYPISPRPLRKLVTDSKNIVYAEVIDIRKNKKAKENDWFKSEIAVLKVHDVLQGKISSTQIIEVYTSTGISCPAPAYFEKGTMTLVFIEKDKNDGRYQTPDLSYGSKILSKDDYAVYKKRILEMQDILKIKDPEEQHVKTVDWLVDCALEKATRWEGTYELSPESDFMSYYDQDKDTFIRKFELNEGQKQKLRNAFLNLSKLQYDDLGILDLIAEKNDKEVLDFLILRFKESAEQFVFEGDFYMSRIAQLSGREDLKQIMEKGEEIDMLSDNYETKSKEIIAEFIAKL